MANYLVTHAGMCASPQRMQPWLDALDETQIAVEATLRFDEPGWASVVQPGDLLMALGGDGTQSAVAAVCVEKGARLAVLPAGTGNDFARALGIPLGPNGACTLIKQGRSTAIDVGTINERMFVNVAHVGLGAQVGLKIPGEIKKRWGPFSYLRHLVGLLFRKRGFWGRLEYDSHTLYGRWLEIAVANGPSFGGGHQIGDASHTNGTLTLVCVRARPLPRLFLAWLASRFGRPLNRKVLRIEHVSRCRLQTHRNLALSADGEAVGYTPMECRILPATLRVISPH